MCLFLVFHENTEIIQPTKQENNKTEEDNSQQIEDNSNEQDKSDDLQNSGQNSEQENQDDGNSNLDNDNTENEDPGNEDAESGGQDNTQENEDNENIDQENNQGNESDDKESDTTYATNLTLNCARSIEMEINSSVELLSGYLIVEPVEKFSEVLITISVDSGTGNGLTFSNNIITATDLGAYKINFEIQKSATQTITDTLIVNVVDKIENKITQQMSSVEIESITYLNDIISIDSSITEYTVITDSKLTYNENYITANETGESTITIKYDANYIRRSISFKLKIMDKPLYSIVITDYSTDTIIENNSVTFNCNIGKSVFIAYEVLNRDVEYVSQNITVEIENESIASFTLNEPLIKLKCLQKGSVNLKIICNADPTVYVVINLTFE